MRGISDNMQKPKEGAFHPAGEGPVSWWPGEDLVRGRGRGAWEPSVRKDQRMGLVWEEIPKGNKLMYPPPFF